MATKNKLGHDKFDKMTTKQLIEAFNNLVPVEKQVSKFPDRKVALRKVRAASKSSSALVRVEREETVDKIRLTFTYPEGTLVAELSRRANEQIPEAPHKPFAGTHRAEIRSSRVKRVTYLPHTKKLSKLHKQSITKEVLDAIIAHGTEGVLMDDLSAELGYRANGFVQKLSEKNHVGITLERPREVDHGS